MSRRYPGVAGAAGRVFTGLRRAILHGRNGVNAFMQGYQELQKNLR